MANYFFKNVSKPFYIHPAWLWVSPCLRPWLNSIPLLSWQCHAKLRATRGPLLAKWTSPQAIQPQPRLIGLWFDSAPGGSGQTPSHVQQLTIGYSSVKGQVSQKPGHDRRLSYKTALFYGHLVWLPFWQTIQNRTHSWTRVSSVCLLFLSRTKPHFHSSTKKTPCTHTPVSDRPVFHWGIIDWKMKMDACMSQALLINETHRVYYGGPAPVPNTSRGWAVNLRCWPPITALTGWVAEHPHDIEAAVNHCWFGRQQYPFSSAAIHCSEWGKEMGWKWAE